MNITISTDKSRLDIALIHNYLHNDSYWAKNIPLEIVERSIANSLCFGVYDDFTQIGFARVMSDCATFAYLADVSILSGYRGKGLSKQLMEYIKTYPPLQGLRRWMLATADAHELYRKYGFTDIAKPERLMELTRPNIYATKTSQKCIEAFGRLNSKSITLLLLLIPSELSLRLINNF